SQPDMPPAAGWIAKKQKLRPGDPVEIQGDGSAIHSRILAKRRPDQRGDAMNLRIFTTTLGALAISSAFVIGPSHAAGTADKLKAWDLDKDGTIDLAETGKAAEARFDSLEGDNDGTLDAKEMGPTKVDKATFAKADPDNDGTLD